MNYQGTKTQRGQIPEDLDRIASVVVDATLDVHSQLGPGLLESVHEVCLAHAVEKRAAVVEPPDYRLGRLIHFNVPLIRDGIKRNACKLLFCLGALAGQFPIGKNETEL